MPTLEAQKHLLNLQQSPARSVGDEVNANVAINAAKSRIDAVPDDENDWDSESAVNLDTVERVDVK